MTAPRKPVKKDRHLKRQVNIRLQEGLVEQAEAFAERHRRTLTSVVEAALEAYLEEHGKKPPIEET